MTTIRLKFSTQDLKVRSWWNRMQSQSTGLFYFHCYILGSLLHHTGDAYTSKEKIQDPTGVHRLGLYSVYTESPREGEWSGVKEAVSKF